MKKIILITCYFGDFPWYFDFFIKSCETNPTVDIILFSDSIWTKDLPKNVTIHPFTLKDFNQLATEKLGFEIDIKRPYKICDFKPAFGVIFENFTDKYDFWGVTDVDLIYGRIREFMTDDVLLTYDLIFIRHDYITTSFALFKNTKYINSLFKKSIDYKKVFTSDEHYCFDESNFEHDALSRGYDIFELNCDIESMQHIVAKEQKLGKINVHFDFLIVEGISGKLKWNNGILSYNKKLEALLFHLIVYKNNVHYLKIFWNKIPNVFYIDKISFRKNNSFFDNVKKICVNNIKPFVFMVSLIVDLLVSFFLSKGKVKNISVGNYHYNYYRKNFRIISKDDKGFNVVSFGNNNRKHYIRQMLFHKNFYFDTFSKTFFKYRTNNHSKYMEVIYYNGNIQSFELNT